jgi:sortase A
MSVPERRLARRFELGLVVVGVACVAWVSYGALRIAAFRSLHMPAYDATPAVPVEAPEAGLGADGMVGLLEIPRLGISEIVAPGDDDETLSVAIGHLPDTPFPWGPGNSVLAAHRDTHFRELRHIRAGDLVRLKTHAGLLEYEVSHRLIVSPTDVWVMAPSTARQLTLITCYPFDYVGSAPQRFVVQATAR